MPTRLPVAALAASILLVGCGSTVQRTSTISGARGNGIVSGAAAGTDAGTLDGPGTAADGSTDPAADPGTAGDPGTADTTVTTTGGGGSTAGPSAATGSGTSKPTTGTAQTAASAIPAKGPGWDEKTIFIGAIIQTDQQKAFATVGANVDTGDTTTQLQASIAAVNAKGGLFGRQLVLKTDDISTLDTAKDPDTAGAAACTHFAQDVPVVAVVNVVTLLDYAGFRTCMAKAKIPVFSSSLKAVDDTASAALAPYFYQLDGVSWTEVAPVLVARLKAQGWATPWDTTAGAPGGVLPVKVGVLVDGSDVGTRTGALLKKDLSAAGIDSVVYQYTDASQGQSASVVYFKGNNVTHVIVTDVELTAFQGSAGQQNWKPRYGVTTYNNPYNGLENAGALTPAGSNNGAMGIGWAQSFDVSATNDKSTPAFQACLATLKAGGENYDGRRLAQAFGMTTCDAVDLITQGAAAGGGLTGKAIGAGIVKIAPQYAPATGFAAALTGPQHFVSGLAYDLAYGTDCSCFTYGAGSASF